MKLVVAPVLFLLAIASVHAGGFGGPRPFTNQSPLTTGVNGSYQAIAKGTNLSGIIRFSYANGVQSVGTPAFLLNGMALSDPNNDYIFFVGGLSYRGFVQAAINGPQISGVLDNGGAQVVNTSDSSTGTTSSGVNILTFMSGYFNGRANENSPEFYFKGDGHVQVFNFDTATSLYNFGNEENFQFSGVRITTGS